MIYLGPKKVVVLGGYKTVKEALVNHDDEFGNRDPMKIVDEMSQGYGKEELIISCLDYLFPFCLTSCFIQGVLWSNGDSWREMRRFTLSNLRDFGMGKKACEDKISEECCHLIEVFKKFRGKID